MDLRCGGGGGGDFDRGSGLRCSDGASEMLDGTDLLGLFFFLSLRGLGVMESSSVEGGLTFFFFFFFVFTVES